METLVPETNKELMARVLEEQVQLAMRQIPAMQGTSIGVAVILSYLVRHIVPHGNIVTWDLMILGVAVSRFAVYNRFLKVRQGRFDGEQWRNVYLILALLSGIIWGSSALLIFPSGRPGLLTIYAVVITSLSAFTTISHSSIKLAPMAWSGPALLFYAIRFTLQGGELGYALGLMSFIYLFAVLAASIQHHKSIDSTIALKLEKMVLVERLTQAKEDWERIFDAAPDLMALLDDQQRIVRLNRSMADRLGLKPEECLGMKCYEAVHRTPEAPEFCPHALTCQDGQEHSAEVSEPLLGGEFLVTTTPRLDGQGRFAGSMHVARDITGLKRTERALRFSNTLLELANRHDELPSMVRAFVSELKALIRCNAAGARVLGEDGEIACEVSDGFDQPLDVVDGWLHGLVQPLKGQVTGAESAMEATAGVRDDVLFFHSPAAGALPGSMPTDSSPPLDKESKPYPYESLARIQIISGQRLVGRMYVADVGAGCSSQELAQLFDIATGTLGTAIEKVRAQESLGRIHRELEERVERRTQELAMANSLLKAEVLARERAEQGLRRESGYLRAIITGASDGICVWYPIEEHPYIRFTVWNRSMVEITGYSKEEMNRIGWAQALYDDPEMQVSVLEYMKGALEQQAFQRLERNVMRADGQRRTIVISSSVIQPNEGEHHVVVAVQDITDLKAAEHALLRSEAKFRGLVENIGVGMSIVQERHVTYQNPEQQHLLGGRLSAPFPLLRMVELVHPDDRPLFEKLCETARCDSAASLDMVHRIVLPKDNGIDSTRWINCSWRTIEHQGGEAQLVQMVDITQLKDLERLVLQREKMASLGYVAAGIAHEIRNPLSGINIYLHGIRDCWRDPESAEDVERLIEEALATSNKMGVVIRRVLDFSRPTDLKLRLTFINDTIHEAVKLTAVSLRKAGIILDLDLEPDLPQVYADAQFFEQLMLNLITNAIEALKSIPEERRIRISTQIKEGFVLIRVEDSGPGVPAEMREQIFDPFFSTSSGGTGIGLGICKRIAVDHGGDVSVSSSTLGGAQFNVEIPVEKRRNDR